MSPRNPKHDCHATRDANSIVLAGVPDWITADLIEQTIAVWQPYYASPLTFADAVEIISNAGRLGVVLSRADTNGSSLENSDE